MIGNMSICKFTVKFVITLILQVIKSAQQFEKIHIFYIILGLLWLDGGLFLWRVNIICGGGLGLALLAWMSGNLLFWCWLALLVAEMESRSVERKIFNLLEPPWQCWQPQILGSDISLIFCFLFVNLSRLEPNLWNSSL